MNETNQSNLHENLIHQDLVLGDDPSLQKIYKPRTGHNHFKFNIFMEFLSYFTLKFIFGPFSYLIFLNFIKNGPILARNLNIYGGYREILRLMIWLAKIFCIVTTFVLNPNAANYQYDSISQFWLLIYTEISLIVLYAAYYSSFTDDEINKFRTEAYDNDVNIFDRLSQLVYSSKSKISDKVVLYEMFPEIEQRAFYFVFPPSHEDTIPTELESVAIKNSQEHVREYFAASDIIDGFIVPGERFADYIAETAGYQHFKRSSTIIKVISRLLIVVRIILPVASNIYLILVYSDPLNDSGHFILYVTQQIFYSILIYRFVAVYDVLFLGLVLYKKKYNMLAKLGEVVSLKRSKKKNNEGKAVLRVSGCIPQNAISWLNVRRILSSVNEQAFVVVDTNMSFVLLYTFMFVAIYFLQVLGLFKSLLSPAQKFLEDNPQLLIVLGLTVLVVIVVIVVDVVMGILINGLFRSNRCTWMLNNHVAQSMALKREIHVEDQLSQEKEEDSVYYQKLKEIQELLGPKFREGLDLFLRRLRNSISLTLDGIVNEEKYNPHTLLGLPTTPTVVVTVGTITSALGVTTLSQVILAITGKVEA